MLSSEKLSFRFIAMSNLMAAFGGGMILGKGTGVIQVSWLHGGSLLAFFIGTVLGLFFMQIVPKSFSIIAGRFFSITGGLVSLMLYGLFNEFSHAGKMYNSYAILFFILLSFRFGFWFFSRVMRAANAAGQQQKIAWVELGYYVGIILGLIFWKFFNFNLALGTALLIDAVLQILAGVMDFCGAKNHIENVNIKNSAKLDDTNSNKHVQPYDATWAWRCCWAVVLLTVATQVTVFNIAHQLSSTYGSFLLALFYFGVAVAAWFCHHFKLFVQWNARQQSEICSHHSGKEHKANFFIMTCFLFLILMLVVSIIEFTILHQIDVTFFWPALVCLLIFAAAFIYEIFALVLLDRMGYEEKLSNHNGSVMRTYGLMGIGAVISMALLGIFDSFLPSSFLMLATSFVFTITLIAKRRKNMAYDSVICAK